LKSLKWMLPNDSANRGEGFLLKVRSAVACPAILQCSSTVLPFLYWHLDSFDRLGFSSRVAEYHAGRPSMNRSRSSNKNTRWTPNWRGTRAFSSASFSRSVHASRDNARRLSCRKGAGWGPESGPRVFQSLATLRILRAGQVSRTCGNTHKIRGCHRRV
jgi:hypothetical protein